MKNNFIEVTSDNDRILVNLDNVLSIQDRVRKLILIINFVGGYNVIINCGNLKEFNEIYEELKTKIIKIV